MLNETSTPLKTRVLLGEVVSSWLTCPNSARSALKTGSVSPGTCGLGTLVSVYESDRDRQVRRVLEIVEAALVVADRDGQARQHLVLQPDVPQPLVRPLDVGIGVLVAADAEGGRVLRIAQLVLLRDVVAVQVVPGVAVGREDHRVVGLGEARRPATARRGRRCP